MTDTRVPSRVFPRAKQEADRAKGGISTPQTQDPAYRLAFQDMDFLLREDLRPIRFQLELLKPELILAEANIASTFVFYGSARIPEPDKAQALLAAAPADGPQRTIAGQSDSRSIESESDFDSMLERARCIDAAHRADHGRPIFANNLRRELAIGTAKARDLTSTPAIRLRPCSMSHPAIFCSVLSRPVGQPERIAPPGYPTGTGYGLKGVNTPSRVVNCEFALASW